MSCCAYLADVLEHGDDLFEVTDVEYREDELDVRVVAWEQVESGQRESQLGRQTTE